MTGDTRPRLFVVEDHDIVRFGIERLLEDRFRLVGSADEVASAVELIRERNPDVVLLDVAIPGGGGAAVPAWTPEYRATASYQRAGPPPILPPVRRW